MADNTTTTPVEATVTTTQLQSQGQADPAANPRTYTQEECNAIAAKEAGRTDRGWLKLLGVGSKDEVQTVLDQIKAAGVLSARATQAEKDLDELRKKYDTATLELSALKNAQTLSGYGITDDDERELLAYKIGKQATNGKSFEDAAKEYFEAHPRSRVSVQLGPQQQGSAPSSSLNERINAKLRGET